MHLFELKRTESFSSAMGGFDKLKVFLFLSLLVCFVCYCIFSGEADSANLEIFFKKSSNFSA